MPTTLKVVPRLDSDEPIDLSQFVHGRCYELATAISEGTGWPIVALMRGNVIYHAAVKMESGEHEGFYVDGRDLPFAEDLLGEPFGIRPPFETRIITRAELEISRPMSTIDIAHARRLAEEKWPGFPWKPTELTKKVIAFASAIEKLSREHGIWIRAPFPTTKPMIALGEGDENGYIVDLYEDGATYTIDRLLEGQT